MPAVYRFRLDLPGGLHARPATLLAELAAAGPALLTFVNERTRLRCDCRSVLTLLASDSRQGDPCHVEGCGRGAQRAVAAAQRLIETEWRAGREAPPPGGAAAGSRLPRRFRGREETAVSGVVLSPGLALGPLWRRHARPAATPPPPLPFAGVRREKARFHAARAELAEALSVASGGAPGRDILSAQRAMLLDPALAERVDQAIATERLPAAEAVLRAGEPTRRALTASTSEYLRERVADFDEVVGRLTALLRGQTGDAPDLSLPGPAILAAVRLTPTELLGLDRQKLLGLVLGETGATSHTAILARALAIPCLSALVPPPWPDGLEVVLDARRGFLLPVRDEADRRYVAIERQVRGRHQATLAEYAARPAATLDGQPLEIAANVASVEETRTAMSAGADGVGLLRTEMLFIGREDPPDEEEQTRCYTAVLAAAGSRPVIVRTADIGGDKPAPFLDLPVEANPFLGCRGIRLYRDHPDLRDTQLRALLRASAQGPLRIMFPMVTTVAEVRTLRRRLHEVQAEMTAAGIATGALPALGVMLEVPALAFQIAELAEVIDFVSLGSNDLLQYFLAVDRGQPSLAELARPWQPSFLRFLRLIARETKGAGLWLGLCGELAGEPLMLPLLVGLGLDEISLAASRIAETKVELGKLSADACRDLLEEACRCPDAPAVAALLLRFTGPVAPASPLDARLIRLESTAASREEILRELALTVELAGRGDDGDAIEEALWQREEIHSTAIGFGLAVPHCRSPHIHSASLAIVRTATPVSWPALDDLPVRLVLLLALPATAAEADHLKMLATLSRQLMHEEFRTALLAATTAEEVLGLLQGRLGLA